MLPSIVKTDSLATDMSDQRNTEERARRMPVATGRQQQRVEPRMRPFPSVKERNWPGTLMVLGIFSAIFTLAWTGRRTVVSIEYLARALALLCVAGNLLPYAWTGLRAGMARFEWFMFNLLAVGPLTICALLLLNAWVHGPVTYTTAGFGSGVTVEVKEDDGSSRSLVLGWPGSLEFGPDEMRESGTGRYRVGVAKGCLGYWVVVERKVVRQVEQAP